LGLLETFTIIYNYRWSLTVNFVSRLSVYDTNTVLKVMNSSGLKTKAFVVRSF